jgi:hypothetical protein
LIPHFDYYKKITAIKEAQSFTYYLSSFLRMIVFVSLLECPNQGSDSNNRVYQVDLILEGFKDI